jgi:serpin B
MADALAAIDSWTNDKTHGKIPKLFDSLDPATVLVLANALYFHAEWQRAFEPALTEAEPFTKADGTAVQVDFMSGGAGLQANVTAQYEAAQLPYAGNRFAALAVMPTGTPLPDFVASLTPAKIDAMTSAMAPATDVALPRFTTTSTLDLKPVLQALGMQRAFTDSADMSGLSTQPTAVDQIIQRDYLQVGEYGTTAAAVTGGAMIATSGTVGPAVRFDHPFLFLIRDTETGAILFASEITDPSAS